MQANTNAANYIKLGIPFVSGYTHLQLPLSPAKVYNSLDLPFDHRTLLYGSRFGCNLLEHCHTDMAHIRLLAANIFARAVFLFHA